MNSRLLGDTSVLILTEKQLEKLVEVLEGCTDKGPPEAGWSSPELYELKCIAQNELEDLRAEKSLIFCPHCGNGGADKEEPLRIERGERGTYEVSCGRCKCIGPPAEDEENAKHRAACLWNQRAAAGLPAKE